jgi:hypothetical protein
MTAMPPKAESLRSSDMRKDRAKQIYRALMCDPDASSLEAAREYLTEQLELAEQIPGGMPDSIDVLDTWVAQNASHVADQYSEYLADRKKGGPRRFFKNRAHAQYFIRGVAPTKLVDGSWLYSTLRHTSDWRYHGLIRTYLEELGDGEPSQNHVSLYQKLIADLECDPLDTLSDDHYVQGALQLALGHLGDDFAPEVIGFNLGYEQLPLHLLISSFELNELGIDPYYFTLHITIDNASTGHAYKAVKALRDLIPPNDRDAFMKRVRAGYQLNELGKGTSSVIASFDIDAEVVEMLERKRVFGQHMHSDYCKLEGRTVNEWLAEPGSIPAFLEVLQAKGWIKRGEPVAESRFWRLIEGDGAAMFGVFSEYEKQLLKDWITEGEIPGDRENPFRLRFRHHPLASSLTGSQSPTPEDEALLKAVLTSSHGAPFDELVPLLAPHMHATALGLDATRAFAHTFASRPNGAH